MPYGGASFFLEKATQFLYVLMYGAEKSICIATGSPFVYYDWFSASANAVGQSIVGNVWG